MSRHQYSLDHSTRALVVVHRNHTTGTTRPPYTRQQSRGSPHQTRTQYVPQHYGSWLLEFIESRIISGRTAPCISKSITKTNQHGHVQYTSRSQRNTEIASHEIPCTMHENKTTHDNIKHHQLPESIQDSVKCDESYSRGRNDVSH